MNALLLEMAGEICTRDEFDIVGTFSALLKTPVSHVLIQ